MSTTPLFSLRFPMVRRVVSAEGLTGARECAAHMVAIAQIKRRSWLSAVRDLADARRMGRRDLAVLQLMVDLDANSIREAALWARRFAKGIDYSDPRWAAVDARGTALRAHLHEYAHGHNALAA